MPATFTSGEEIETIAAPLIRDYHQHLITHNVRMEYVFRSDLPKRNGKEVWGTARKISSLAAFLASNGDEWEASRAPGEPFFVICISRPRWNTLNEAQRKALVDHELCHCWAEYEESKDDGPPVTKISVLRHDVEEFGCIIERHGLWTRHVTEFFKTAGQMSLDLSNAAPLRFATPPDCPKSVTITHEHLRQFGRLADVRGREADE